MDNSFDPEKSFQEIMDEIESIFGESHQKKYDERATLVIFMAEAVFIDRQLEKETKTYKPTWYGILVELKKPFEYIGPNLLTLKKIIELNKASKQCLLICGNSLIFKLFLRIIPKEYTSLIVKLGMFEMTTPSLTLRAKMTGL